MYTEAPNGESMKILKNYFYNLLYEVAALVVPLVLTPYISRVLEVDGIGKYSVAVAISNYFILFGMLGINMYGNRQIAYVRDNQEVTRNTFWEINVMKMLSMGAAILVYIGFVFFAVAEDRKTLYYLQVFTLLASLVDISWLFTGLENFRKTTIRSIIVKFSSVGLVLLLVKTRDDLALYAGIIGATTFLGQLVLWLSVPSHIRRLSVRREELKRHFFATIQLWLPSIAVQIYASLDKIMLGYIVGDVQAGLYESSQKLIKMVSVISTSFTTATLPRMSNLYNNGSEGGFKELTERSVMFLSFLSVPLAFGLIGIRKTLIPWFFGPGYEEIVNLLLISSWLLVSLAWSSIFGTQVLVACNQEKKFTRAVFVNLVINVVLNIILIPRLGARGALIASVCAECTGTTIMVLYAKRLYNLGIPKGVLRYFLAGACMCVVVSLVGSHMQATVLTTGIQIVVGVIVYFVILLLMRDGFLLGSLSYARKLLGKLHKGE